jgi:hypothetical protein
MNEIDKLNHNMKVLSRLQIMMELSLEGIDIDLNIDTIENSLIGIEADKIINENRDGYQSVLIFEKSFLYTLCYLYSSKLKLNGIDPEVSIAEFPSNENSDSLEISVLTQFLNYLKLLDNNHRNDGQ